MLNAASLSDTMAKLPPWAFVVSFGLVLTFTAFVVWCFFKD